MRFLKSWKFWLSLTLAPLVLVACTNLFVSFDSDFESDEFVSRHQVQSGTTTLSYLLAGDPNGQRVIFLHGTPGDAGGNWHQMLKDTPKGYEFIAVDRPGFGHTLPRSEVTSLQAQAQVLRPLLVSRNGRGTILVGHSLGGPVVARAAVDHPDKVAGIVVAAGALDPDLEEVLFIQHVGDTPPISWLLAPTLRHSNRELIALEKELRLLEPHLSAIRQPVLIVHGTADELVPYANVDFMKSKITNSRHLEVITLEGMNHFLQWRSQAEIMHAIQQVEMALGHPDTK